MFPSQKSPAVRFMVSLDSFVRMSSTRPRRRNRNASVTAEAATELIWYLFWIQGKEKRLAIAGLQIGPMMLAAIPGIGFACVFVGGLCQILSPLCLTRFPFSGYDKK